MGIFSEVKCARCDRRFSGLRSRCPYCGARRMGRGRLTGDDENAKGRMIIGIIILAVLVVAVVVLLVTSLGDNEGDPVLDDPNNTTGSPIISDEDDITSVTGSPSITPPGDIVSESPPETSPPVQVINSVTIMYLGSKKEEFTAKIGEKVPLSAKIDPADTEETPVWESSDENVFVVLSTGVVTGVGTGTATLTVTVGDVTAKCIVRVVSG